MSEKKMTSSRRHHLKSLMLQIAANWIEKEKKEIADSKQTYLAENCAAPDLFGDQAALMETCKKLHALIDKIDEERYDLEIKVGKADKEIDDLKIKVVDLAGVKKPALKKVRMSADAMLKALLGSKHTVNLDLRANLKQVKKEVKEEPAEAVGDWRKNIEDKADRKKMFESASCPAVRLTCPKEDCRPLGLTQIYEVSGQRMTAFQELIGLVSLRVPHGHKRRRAKPRPSPYIPHRVDFVVSDSLAVPQSCSLPHHHSVAAVVSDLRVGNHQEADMSEGKRMTSSRRHHLKSLMLQIAANLLEQEADDIIAAKEAYIAEKCAALNLSGDQAALMEVCKKLHQAIDKIDEERYDTQVKVEKTDKEINELKMKVIELAGVKKPALKKVRMSADAMLKALLGSKHTVNMDLRANLKQVKKEVKEEPAEAVGDWRKNIEDKADRKKMFESS
ncbi:uncharacterized protein LOC115781316 [Archocentrus centrarchus]|uniref:uncharacterized protein LOC115781316 n=1 Tax=Archocentrus centrarchus TaxID=63155 RepID=UPI0011EA409D|nr:uncharacterized protein LOC115781316 [Archocentrus centrarchus]